MFGLAFDFVEVDPDRDPAPARSPVGGPAGPPPCGPWVVVEAEAVNHGLLGRVAEHPGRGRSARLGLGRHRADIHVSEAERRRRRARRGRSCRSFGRHTDRVGKLEAEGLHRLRQPPGGGAAPRGPGKGAVSSPEPRQESGRCLGRGPARRRAGTARGAIFAGENPSSAQRGSEPAKCKYANRERSSKLPHNQGIANSLFVLVFSPPPRTLRLNFPPAWLNLLPLLESGALSGSGEDHNWWVGETSDPVRWDVDGPQRRRSPAGRAPHRARGLRCGDYEGFDQDHFEAAFIPFRIDKDLGGGKQLAEADEGGRSSTPRRSSSRLPRHSRRRGERGAVRRPPGPPHPLPRGRCSTTFSSSRSKLSVDEVVGGDPRGPGPTPISSRAAPSTILRGADGDSRLHASAGHKDDEEHPAKEVEVDEDLPEVDAAEEEKLKNDESLKWDEDEDEEKDEDDDEKKKDDDEDGEEKGRGLRRRGRRGGQAPQEVQGQEIVGARGRGRRATSRRVPPPSPGRNRSGSCRRPPA